MPLPGPRNVLSQHVLYQQPHPFTGWSHGAGVTSELWAAAWGLGVGAPMERGDGGPWASEACHYQGPLPWAVAESLRTPRAPAVGASGLSSEPETRACACHGPQDLWGP